MKAIQVRLDFPIERIGEPVVTTLVKRFDVLPNVLAADIEAGKGGWMVLGLSGDSDRIDSALRWIAEAGIAVRAEPD